MQKFLKYSISAFIVIIILLLIVPFFIPLEKYKETAADKVKELTGRKLEINGDMSLSLLPTPEIKIKDIKLSSVPGAQYTSLLEAKELTVSVSLFSLLSGNIDISGIKIKNPVINLERLPNELSSWEFSQTDQKVNKDSNEKISEKKEPFALYIKSIEVLEAKINYVDSTSGSKNTTSSTVEIDNFGIKNFHGPANLACEFYSSGKDYNLKGNIKEDKDIIVLKTNLNLLKEEINIFGTFDRNDISFKGNLQLEGDAKNLQTIGLNLDVHGGLNHKLTFNINADKKLLKISDIDLTMGGLSAKGNANYYIEKNTADLNIKLNPGNIDIILTPVEVLKQGLNEKIYIKAASLEPVINALKINTKDLPDIFNKAFTFSANTSYLDQNLLLNDIVLIINKANLKGNLGVNWAKDLAVSYDLKISGLPAFANLTGVSLPVNIEDIGIKGEAIRIKDQFKTDSVVVAARTTNIIKGDIILKDAMKPSLTLVSSGDNLGQTLGQLLKSTPSALLSKYSLSAKIEGDATKIIEINIDKSTFFLKNKPLNINGLVSLNLVNVKPKILADLKISSLNLETVSNVSPTSNTANITAERTTPSTPWSNDKMDLSFLNKADADLTITIQKIIKGELVFDSIKTTMHLANGVLDLKSLNGGLYGGRLEASGQVSAGNGQPASFKATLKGAVLKSLVPQGGKIKVTQGTVNFDTDLKTKGHTQYQYVSNLFGNAKLTATDGRVSGFDLQKVLNSLKNIKNLDGILKIMDASFSGGETAFKQLDVNTDIKDGTANITNFKLDAPYAAVSTTGYINFPKYTLDVNGTIKVDIESMPPFKVNIYGSLNNPQHKLNTKALQDYLVKNVLTNVIDNIKKGKNPEDILKGLIGIGNKNSSSEEEQNNPEAPVAKQRNPAKDLESEIKKGLKGLFK